MSNIIKLFLCLVITFILSSCAFIQKWGGTPLLIGRSEEKLKAVQAELGGNCPILSDCDFASLETTSQILSSALKGEKLQGEGPHG